MSPLFIWHPLRHFAQVYALDKTRAVGSLPGQGSEVSYRADGYSRDV